MSSAPGSRPPRRPGQLRILAPLAPGPPLACSPVAAATAGPFWPSRSRPAPSFFASGPPMPLL
eukprot:15464983-Alexandrium_andersonii.AAC.1